MTAKAQEVGPKTPTAVASSGIRDNYRRGNAGDFLRATLVPDSSLSVVSAYFTIYAFDALKAHLSAIDRLHFLFGEPRFVKALDPERTEKKAFIIDAAGLLLANRLEQKRVARQCAEWIRTKVDIRSVRQSSLLHGKMYHVSHNGVEHALVGSSNFTVRGLGLATTANNIELNLEVDGNRDRQDLKNWFDEMWHDEGLVEDVKDEVLKYLAQLYENHAPEFVYYKTLFHIFSDYLDEAARGRLLDGKTGFFETAVWGKLYAFQRDGVKGAINKLLRLNGCIIADSVGLGKTFEALAVIKYFELLNCRALVLCPKKLEDNWLVYKENDHRNLLLKDHFSYTVRAHTDLGLEKHATHYWSNYDLIVVDESHNFRNSGPGARNPDGSRRRTRYEFLMEEVIQKGVQTRVLLLSATPVNTSLRDLRNQLRLITKGDDAALAEPLGIRDMAQTMHTAQSQFNVWADPKRNPRRKVAGLLEKLDSGFFALLDGTMIARSRRHVMDYYAHDEFECFPERLRPKVVHAEIDAKGLFPSYDELHGAILNYKLSLFNPSAFLKSEHRNKYATDGQLKLAFDDQRSREHFLIGMMKVNYLKRLESSITSFALSIGRTMQKIDDLIGKIDHFEANLESYSHIDLFDAQDEDELAELREQLSVGKKNPIQLRHIDLDAWRIALKADRGQLLTIHAQAEDVKPPRDAKLAELRRLIEAKQAEPVNPGNHKILIFTAYADTARYLYDELCPWIRDRLGLHVALVVGTGSNQTTFRPRGFERQSEFSAILTNFSPRSKGRAEMPNMPQDGEVDILIATDCISEGQNLQDCDCLINYDIHWNPVRIIQRFGRIDRLGSTNKQLQMINFWPVPDLNKYINLRDRVEARMALVDLTATGGDNLLEPEQLRDLINDELTYRDRQLLRLKDEIIDLEDMDDNVSLSEFTLDDFRVDLMNYLEKNRQALEDAPLGLYAVVPTPASSKTPELFDQGWHEIIKSGVVYCLRHAAGTSDAATNRVNPLAPHYLVYVRDDGEVRFAFTQAKQTLQLFQKLCVGKTEAYRELCDLFDDETADGANMHKYERLLAKTIAAIGHTFRRRVAAGLQSGRDFVIPERTEQANGNDDFDLITWLVIKEASLP